MPSGYPGLDASQIIFGGAMILVLIAFAYWGWLISHRLKKVEKAMRDIRDFRELEPEGYDEEDSVDAFSEGARLDADEQGARQRDILEHNT